MLHTSIREALWNDIVRGRYQLVVQISPSAAECQQNWSYMVRLEVKPRSAKQTGLLNQSLLVHNPDGRGRPRSRPPSGQWTFHDAACDQVAAICLWFYLCFMAC